MKKFFSLFAAALMVLSVSAANLTEAKSVKMFKSDRFAPVAVRPLQHKAVVKHAPAVATDAAYTIVVDSITAGGAHIVVTPAGTAPYYWDVIDKETYDAIIAGEWAEDGIADLCDYTNDYIAYLISYYAQIGWDLTLEDFLYDAADAYTYSKLDPNTEYVVYAISVDPETGDCGADLVTTTFTTLDGVIGDEYDMQEDVNVAYATADVVSFEVDGEEGYAYVRIVKDDEMFATLIYLAEGATTLPAGTYPINDTYEPGTAQSGQISGQSVYPTFWATMDAEGYLNLPLFFCVDGSVVVSYDAAGELVLDVNATNTWGNSLHLTLNGAAQAVENVEAGVKAVKTVKNGQLVIIKNGVEFNAQGAKL